MNETREGEMEEGDGEEGNDGGRANEAGESSGKPREQKDGERAKVVLLKKVDGSDGESSSVYFTLPPADEVEEQEGDEQEELKGETSGKLQEDVERAKWKLAQLNKKRDVYESDEEN